MSEKRILSSLNELFASLRKNDLDFKIDKLTTYYWKLKWIKKLNNYVYLKFRRKGVKPIKIYELEFIIDNHSDFDYEIEKHQILSLFEVSNYFCSLANGVLRLEVFIKEYYNDQR